MKKALLQILNSKRGLTWGFVAKMIIWLVMLSLLAYMIFRIGKSSGGIIQKIGDIF